MKKLVFLIISVSLFVAFFSLNDSDAAMTDYCAVPPYVIQDVPPNVMIVLDNSGSMHGFAYYDGMDTADISDDKICDIGSGSDYPCTCINNPCTDFDPAHEYYGYFNPDYWYTYSSNRFVPSAPKTEARPASSWDGNFLNWLTMRRVDVIRKVMTGGRTTSGEGSGFNRLVGEKADETRRGIYKTIGSAENYTPYTGTRKIVFSTGSSSPSTFTVRNAADTGNEATFNVNIKVPLPVEGVLQNVVGTRARLGLSFYQGSSGGYVQVAVAAASLGSAVNQINLTSPNANTPLGEALWSMAGYFAQESAISPIGSPGPRYASGDYQINNTNDPLNYGTGGQPRFPACSKSFILYITDGEPCADGDLPANLENYATGRSDYNCVDTNCPAAGPFAGGAIQSICSVGDDVAGFEDVALWMHTTDLRNLNGTPDVGKDNISGMQNLTLYTIFAFGRGSTLLKYATINGGFEDANGNNQPDLESEWNQDGDTEHKPDNYYEATEGNELEESIRAAFESILKRAASGTAASVLASGEGSGANLIQAVFYPRRRFGNDIIAWTGESQNFWYYADPYFVCSNIREDTTQDNPDSILNLSNDYIAEFYFDTVSQLTKARRFLDSNGDGCKDTPGTPLYPPIVFENLINLWEAGELLWSRDISTDPRTIYTTTDGSTFLTGNFDPTNASTLRQYLDVANDTISAEVIRYMHGEGLTTLRDEDGNILTPPGPGVDRKGTCSVTMSTSCTFDSDCPSGETCVPDSIDDYRGRYAMILGVTNVWKLGDILDSTPRISSWIQLNSYDSRYDDTTYSSFINTSGYKSRGMVFTGGNDGMLHAFKLGTLELSWSGMGGAEKAKLSGTDLGKEMWAFIPKNALPYLKYFMDPEYCHVFTVDLSPFIFDASIGAPGSGDISGDTRAVSSWRTILIGGMRFGGACRGTSTACADVSGDGSKDCVNTPVDVGGSSLGYSSYFALDITDTDNPQLLWEFSHPQLGFTTTGPAVVRIGTGASQTTPDTKNGKWFAVFGSGPTGPIDTTNLQFMGRSDQNLRLFVLDLKTGALATGYPKDTGNAYAFAGSMLGSPIDPDNDYQDDAVYIGYVKRAGSNPNYTWTDGGVGRLLTKEDTTPGNWVWSNVIDGIGAVSASVTKLQKDQGCFNQANEEGCMWLYFGTGRYYFEQGTTVDDPDSQRRLYGIKEPCFNATGFNASCTSSPPSPPSVGTLTNVTDIGNVPTEDTANSASFNGWYLNLDSCTNSSGNPVTCNSSAFYRAERVITDPAALPTAGIVFFTTFKPYNDECGLGGKSFVWAVRYNTGGAPSVSLLKGVALLQVSTGSIEQMNLSTAFTEKGGRRSSSMEGVPPTSMGLSLLSAPPPAKRVLHIRER